MRISFIGLGKLGLCSAACFASAGHTVIGVDTNLQHVAALRERRNLIQETGLSDLLASAWDRFTVTTDAGAAVRDSDVTMIIVPTPSGPDGAFLNDAVLRVLEQIAPALAAKETFHIVDVVSTVMPGSSEGVFIPLLERLTGKRCGVDFGFAYNPEFIALGSVIRNFLNPDMVLIGASDARTAMIVREIYTATVHSTPHYGVMSLINAEITKLSLNCFVTMKISFANELARLCEHLPGADIDCVTAAIGSDSRVGGKYLTGGHGFGGPCFPRDNRALQTAAHQAGTDLLLSPRVIAVNDAVPERILSVVLARKRPGPVAIFGLSYKPDTHIIEESQGVTLARWLVERGETVRVHDPLALPSLRPVLGEAVSPHEDPYEAARGAGALVLFTSWPQFATYDWARLDAEAAPGTLVFDTWRILRGRPLQNLVWHPLGIGAPQVPQEGNAAS